MKKTLFAVLALAAVAACNKSEVVEQNPANAIAFDNAFVDNATKSVNDPSFTNDKMFTDFAVYGFVEGAVLFDGTTVSKDIQNNDLSSDWKYDGTQYWIAGANYNFAAVAPKTNGGWVLKESTTPTAAETTLTFTNNGTTDLLYAQANQQGAVNNNEAVSFDFGHVLSKVKFSFENAYIATNAKIQVREIKITNAYLTAEATLSASEKSWAWASQNGVLVLDFGNAAKASADAKESFEQNKTMESYNELLLIPDAALSDYSVTFFVDLLVSDQVVATYEHTATVNFKPEAGKCYDIKATINASNIDPDGEQEAIEFTVKTLPGWGEYNEETATIQ